MDAAKRQITRLNERIQRAKTIYTNQQTEINKLKGGQHAPPDSQAA